MRVFSKRLLLGITAVLTIFTAQSVLALLTSGVVNYDTGTLKGQINFAVFESRNEFEANWSSMGLSAPGTGQYVYAYLINNASDSMDVSYFALFGLDNNNTSGIGFGDSGYTGAVKPAEAYIDEDESKGVWEWSNQNGYNFIKAGEDSWLLYFSSNQGPVKGEYEIRGPDNTDIVVPDVPEPSVIALLGIGGGFLLMRRRAEKSA